MDKDMDKDKQSALQESHFYTSREELKRGDGENEAVIIQNSPKRESLDRSPLRKSVSDKEVRGQSVASAIIAGHTAPIPENPNLPEATAEETKITIQPEPKEIKDAKEKKDDKKNVPTVPYSALYRYADGFDGFLIFFGTLFSIGNGLGMPFFSIVFGNVLNDFNKPKDEILDAIIWDSYYFLIIGGALFVCSWIGQGFFIYSSERQTKKLRENFLQAILRQEMAWFDQHTPGELGARLVEDAKLFSNALGEKCMTFWYNLTTLLAGLVIGFVKGWQLALVVLGVLPLMGIFGGLLAKVMTEKSTVNLEAYANAGSVADETFNSVRTVQAYSGEDTETKRYSGFLGTARTAGIKKSFLTGASLGGMNFVMFGSYGLCLWFGTWLIRNHIWNDWSKQDWTGGDVMNVFFAVLIGAFSLGGLGPSFEAFATGRASAYRLFQVIDRKPTIDSLSTQGKTIEGLKGELEFRDVYFRYPTRRDARIFEGFNIKIRPGETVALVGQSGSGKSTIISLLERYYDPDQGTVFVDGVDLKELNIEWWRQQVAIVSQEPILFEGTIEDNIRWGKPTATDEEVIEAAKAAHAHIFIDKLPKKYKSTVGSEGTLLSGGQKQRIAIARAVIKNPTLLLLDEATSALDNESERLVQLALEKIMKNRTTVIVAHRLSTIKDADVINVLSEGKIVESGSHSELISRNGVFAALVKAQEMRELIDQGDDKVEDTDSPIDETKEEDDAKETTPLGQTTPLRRQTSVSEKKTPDGTPLRRQSSLKSQAEKDKKVEDDKSEEMKEEVKEVSLMRVLRETRGDVGWIIVGIVGAALVGVALPVWAILFSKITGVMYETDPVKQDQESGFWAGLFMALGTALLLANIGFELGFGITGENLTLKLREMTFRALLRNEIGWFDWKNHSARILTTRLSTDASLVRDGTTKKMGATMQMIATLVTGLVISFQRSPKLAAVTLGTIPLVAAANALQWKFMAGNSGKEQEAYAKAGAIAGEAIANIRTVHSFNGTRKIMNTYSERLLGPLAIGRKTANMAGIGLGFSNFIIFGIYALCWWYGAVLIVNEGLSFENMLAAIFAIVMCGFGVGQASQMVPNVAAATAAKNQIYHILDRKPLIDASSPEGEKTKFTSGAVTFTNVHFNYPIRPDRPVLKGLNLHIKAGDTVALVGPSGCGKSTVMSLLLRFYDIEKGSITIDGVEIKNENIRALREQIGLVSQEPRLFDASIRDNILYGKPDATQDEIVEACKMANIHEWIMTQPDNYNTICGVKGGKLSGGQKQRVAIARALIRNPKILLLDEATSALDSESEKIVQAALDRLIASKTRTVIVIAHRLSTVQASDRIFVFDQGRVVEEGTHQHLLKLDGMYSNLVKAGIGSQT